MFELLLSILVFVLAVAGMGIGLLHGRRGIQGSCGGLNNIPGAESDCGGVCRRPCRKNRNNAPAPESRGMTGHDP
jgi:hypothetical protein